MNDALCHHVMSLHVVFLNMKYILEVYKIF